ncbi:LORF2 protein, partial [Crocuta crocuta]
LFNKQCWGSCMSACRGRKLDPYLTPYTKINSKRIKDLNISLKNRKLLEENMGINLCDLRLDNGFLGMTPKAQATKKKNGYIGHHRSKKLLHLKGCHQKGKRQPTEVGKIFTNHISDK